MARKGYTPTAPYVDLKLIETLINQAENISELRTLVRKDGPKIGYKAFCYILGQKMTPEAMKPDEAVLAAFTLEKQGHEEAAQEIFKRVADAHPGHAQAKAALK